MPQILCIETATPVCSVALLRNDEVISAIESKETNVHSRELTTFISMLLQQSGCEPSDLDAVAVSKGPGSYTGLRIGVSAAKGLCYGLNIPLLAVNTLESMAWGMLQQKVLLPPKALLCPMIDARRMEVYSALFDLSGNQVRVTEAEIVDTYSFQHLLNDFKMVFFGDGCHKCKAVINHPNAIFIDEFQPSAAHMEPLVSKRFSMGAFENLAYFEPFYLKDFIPGIPKVKGL